jgi:hypothetical protein
MRTTVFRLVTFAAASLASLAVFAQHHPQACSARFMEHRDSLPNTIDFNAFLHGPNVTYAWDFGDGSSAATADVQHTYAAAGTYYVCLTVTRTDTAGVVICSDTHCDSVHAEASLPAPPPAVCNAHFRYFGRMGNNSIRFFGGRASGGTATYSWDFGDGTTDTLRSPYHTYAATGTYYVCLTLNAFDSLGNGVCSDTWCDSIIVGLTHHPGGFFHSFGTAHHHRLSGDGTDASATVSIYPHPMTDRATLLLEGFDGPVTFLLYNLNGQVVMENSVLSNGEFLIERGALTAGVYFYQAAGAERQVKGKLIIE